MTHDPVVPPPVRSQDNKYSRHQAGLGSFATRIAERTVLEEWAGATRADRLHEELPAGTRETLEMILPVRS
jgi:hypothetical protein